MQEIKCPKCGEVFQVDKSLYASIVKQVRDNEFLKEVKAKNEASKEENQNDKVIFRKVISEKDIYGNPYLIRSPKEFKFMVTTKNKVETENEKSTTYEVSDIYKCRIIASTYSGFDYPARGNKGDPYI